MSKREQKIEVIRKYISNAAGSWPAYAYGNIPKTLLSNACYSYAGAIQKEDVLGLIDITVLGNGKKGLVFTENKIYYNNGIMSGQGAVSYQSIYENESVPADLLDVAYNKTALKEMVSKLASIEGTTLMGTFDEMLNEANEIVDMVKKGKAFLKELGILQSDEDKYE